MSSNETPKDGAKVSIGAAAVEVVSGKLVLTQMGERQHSERGHTVPHYKATRLPDSDESGARRPAETGIPHHCPFDSVYG